MNFVVDVEEVPVMRSDDGVSEKAVFGRTFAGIRNEAMVTLMSKADECIPVGVANFRRS